MAWMFPSWMMLQKFVVSAKKKSKEKRKKLWWYLSMHKTKFATTCQKHVKRKWFHVLVKNWFRKCRVTLEVVFAILSPNAGKIYLNLHLTKLKMKLLNEGEVLLCRDFNARTDKSFYPLTNVLLKLPAPIISFSNNAKKNVLWQPVVNVKKSISNWYLINLDGKND